MDHLRLVGQLGRPVLAPGCLGSYSTAPTSPNGAVRVALAPGHDGCTSDEVTTTLESPKGAAGTGTPRATGRDRERADEG